MWAVARRPLKLPPRRVLLAHLTTATLALASAPSPPWLNRPVLSQPVRFGHLCMVGPSSRPPTASTHAGALPREPTDVTKWVVSGAAALVIATRRDLASVLCVSGAVLNALLAKLLKRLLKEERPAGARLRTLPLTLTPTLTRT